MASTLVGFASIPQDDTM
jgi:hypothetical protein